MMEGTTEALPYKQRAATRPPLGHLHTSSQLASDPVGWGMCASGSSHLPSHRPVCMFAAFPSLGLHTNLLFSSGNLRDYLT
jgi:hypothetical protein